MKYIIQARILDDNEFDNFISEWIDSFSSDIKNSWPDVDATKQAIVGGIVRAMNASLGVMEMYDYFSISYPGILHRSSDHEPDQKSIFELFERTMAEIIDNLENE